MDLYKKGELSMEDFCTDIKGCGDLKHKGPHEVGIVLFYASWCGHCVNFKPTWEKLLNEETSKVFFKSYNAGTKPPFWSGKKNSLVQGYPTIVKYRRDKSGVYVYTETFMGPRTVEDLKKFAGLGSQSRGRATRKSELPVPSRARATRPRSVSRKPVARKRAKSVSRKRAQSTRARSARGRSLSRKRARVPRSKK